jgi:hypothetical protein
VLIWKTLDYWVTIFKCWHIWLCHIKKSCITADLIKEVTSYWETMSSQWKIQVSETFVFTQKLEFSNWHLALLLMTMMQSLIRRFFCLPIFHQLSVSCLLWALYIGCPPIFLFPCPFFQPPDSSSIKVMFTFVYIYIYIYIYISLYIFGLDSTYEREPESFLLLNLACFT